MSSLNKAMIIGHLGDDPEVRYTQSNTAVANISVATGSWWKDKNGDWQEETQWHRIVLWGRLAEVASEYLKKGSNVYIEGPIETRKWEDKEGQTRYTTEIKGLKLIMLDSKGGGSSPSAPSSKQAEPEEPVESMDDIEDDLPF